jgi:hypothetical protein
MVSEHTQHMTTAESQEKARLEECKASIRNALAGINSRLGDYAQEIQARKEYLREALRDMDHIEKIAVRQTIEQTLDSAEVLKEQQQKLHRLTRSLRRAVAVVAAAISGEVFEVVQDICVTSLQARDASSS